MAKYTGPGVIYTKCPFYKTESLIRITCEGVEPGTDIITKFATEQDKFKYQERNCYYYPNSCPIRELLETKYR